MKRRIDSSFQRTVWVAIFALLVQALLPAMLYVAAAKGAYSSEVCTALGIKKVVAKDSGSPQVAEHGQQCPVCTLAASLFLPASPSVLPPAASTLVELSSPAGSQHYVLTRLPLHLRGPPAHG